MERFRGKGDPVIDIAPDAKEEHENALCYLQA